jgi:hypothetical protein
MVVVVLSGFVGRYLYTAAPRDLEGVEVGVRELQQQIAATDRQLAEIGGKLGDAAKSLLAAETFGDGWIVVVARPLLRWRERRRVHAILMQMSGQDRTQIGRLEILLDQHYRLMLQVHSLAATRRLLALWHLFHVPLGGVLFTLAFIHVIAAMYYSTLLK